MMINHSVKSTVCTLYSSIRVVGHVVRSDNRTVELVAYHDVPSPCTLGYCHSGRYLANSQSGHIWPPEGVKVGRREVIIPPPGMGLNDDDIASTSLQESGSNMSALLTIILKM